MADQLVPFLSFARGKSSFITTQITEHLLTNLWVIEQFVNISLARSGSKG
ncbi:MAG: hypothetical protein FJ110_00915 [Deltaproteobacteria bacterium]|nr:hypothetical protein [Deltaproteobacteria bacterium]